MERTYIVPACHIPPVIGFVGCRVDDPTYGSVVSDFRIEDELETVAKAAGREFRLRQVRDPPSRLPACRDGSAIVSRDYESKMKNESIGSMKTCQSRAINTIHANPLFHPENASCLRGVYSPYRLPVKKPDRGGPS